MNMNKYEVEEIKKRQNVQNVCQLALSGFQPTGKLSCCETNGTCIAGPASCSSTNKLAQCWNIRGFDPCTRNDPTSQIVCQHQDGIYCLKGKTDWAYGRVEQGSINWLLSRDKAPVSLNGASYSNGNDINPVTCSDSLASGACQIANDVKQINYFEYQVEVCGNGYDFIVEAPQLSTSPPPVSTYRPPKTTTASSPMQVSGSSGTGGPIATTNNSSSGLQAGGIVGIVFAVLVVVCGLVFLVIKIRNRINAQQRELIVQNQLPQFQEYQANPPVPPKE